MLAALLNLILPNYEADDIAGGVDFGDDGLIYSPVCALCDNGGVLVVCEGVCNRSFHATEEQGQETLCSSLGLTHAELNAATPFMCRNCASMRHQCFACGVLGSSNNAAGCAEVFKCASDSCEYFYHPNCVAPLLHPNDDNAAMEHLQTIAAGDVFQCPLHKCCMCDELENPYFPDLQLAVCRRCPKAYHRRCLPGQIEVDAHGGRAWSKLLPYNRTLMFCLNHEMVPELGTPASDHIQFPA